MSGQLSSRNVRNMSDVDFKAALDEIKRSTAAEERHRRDARVMERLRQQFPDLAAATDIQAAKQNMETYRGLLKQQIASEMALVDASKLNEAAKSSPSQLDRRRAAEKLAAAVALRDSLTLQTEEAHALVYAPPESA